MKTNNIKKLTKKQITKMDQTIVREGVYKCSNGEEIKYKITELDVLNREITGLDILQKLKNGSIHPLHLSLLLTELYGEYPNNRIKENHFRVIN